MKQIQKAIARGVYDPNKDDPFELFISSTTIRWTFYKDSHKILGNTYGMCVLQVRLPFPVPISFPKNPLADLLVDSLCFSVRRLREKVARLKKGSVLTDRVDALRSC
jgi:hypothetical protein